MTESYSDNQLSGSKLVDYVTDADPFVAHLKRLRMHHKRDGNNLVYIIAEVGLPTSWAAAHLSYGGRDHGGLAQADMATKVSAIMTLIKNAGMEGYAALLSRGL